MIRHAGRAAVLFAAGALFAGSAWAQGDDQSKPVTLTQSVTNPYFVAAELLGSADGSVVQLGSAGGTDDAPRPAVRLTLNNGADRDGGAVNAQIPESNTAQIKFDLVGAVFGQNVGAGTLDLRQPASTGDNTVNALSAEVVEGGSTGDSTVTFMVEATDNITAGHRISFWVPDLRVSPTVIGSTATVPPRPITGVAITAELVEGKGRAVKGTEAGQVPFPKVTGGIDTPMDGAVAAMNNVGNRWVVGSEQVVRISMGSPAAIALNVAEVALNNRKEFATSNANHTPKGSTSATRALGLGTLTVSINRQAAGNVIYTLDPSDPAVEGTGEDAELDPDLAGNIDVVVKGAFKTGDMVLYGSDRTAAKIVDGMAAVQVPIAAAGSSTQFMYVPGGVDDLRPGDISVVAMRNFSRSGNNPGRPVMSMGTIEYADVDVHAFAHGVVRGEGTDSSYLRVRCANETDCTVFLDCHDEDGMNYFQEAGAVDAGKTIVWSSDDVAGVFDDGGWSRGRGACDLMSNGDLEVQHMVRSGHTLVNNSAVVGRSLSLDEEQLDGIDAVLANICSSLPGHLGRDANGGIDEDLSTVADNVSMVAATMCNNRLAGGQVVADDVDANGPLPGF